MLRNCQEASSYDNFLGFCLFCCCGAFFFFNACVFACKFTFSMLRMIKNNGKDERTVNKAGCRYKRVALKPFNKTSSNVFRYLVTLVRSYHEKK